MVDDPHDETVPNADRVSRVASASKGPTQYAAGEGGGGLGRWLRSARFVWAAHVALFALFTLILVIFFYQVAFDRIGIITWIAVTAFAVEAVILMANGGRCPITVYNESLGIDSARVSDAFLPKWIADRVFEVYGGAFALALIVLVFRLAQ